ncbi:HD-GYP domain-containing protein [Paenibacillus chartarius]|uniref:HD-GYP domain-containing protein n=1 Tax=Paenibacillus chartarius TaxID=747481 RepID=A0ABV6DN15_9BACL
MRLVSVSSCRPGMKLGRNIYNEDGAVLLASGVELSEPLITRLSRYGIDYVYIQDSRTDDIVIQNILSDETRIRATKEIRTAFRRMMEDAGKKRLVSSYQLGKSFRPLLEDVIDELAGHPEAMIMLTNISVTDHYLYQHSMNVGIYATMLGLAHGYSKEELMVLGLGALLHDIGKTMVPLELLRKPGKLTNEEFAVIRKHAEYGFQILKDEPNIPLISAHCAFQHHERIDGSGYPRGIAGTDIHEYARWIGLVDSYDAMTTQRVYRDTMLPHQAMEILFTGAGTLYDQEKIALFRDKIALYPIGVTVGLNTGETGVVVDLNSSAPHRPVVRVLEDADGQEVQPYEIDLSKKLTVMITAVNKVSVVQF